MLPSQKIFSLSTVPSDGAVTLIQNISTKPISVLNLEAIRKDTECGDLGQVITLPMQVVQMSDEPGSHLQIVEQHSSSQSELQELKENVTLEASVLPSNFSGQLMLHTNADGTRTLVIDSPEFNEENVITIDPKLIESCLDGNNPSSNAREIILKLGDDVNISELTGGNNILSESHPFASEGYNFISPKNVDSNEEVLVSTSSANILDEPITVSCIQSESSLQPTQDLVVISKLSKSDDLVDSADITKKLPETEVITIKCQKNSTSEDQNGPWTCEKCDSTFDRWTLFKKHQRKHLEERPFPCHVCSESFNYEKNLVLHMSLHKLGDLECPECSKSFRRWASLKSHLLVHFEDENLSCDICSEEFFSLGQLEEHQASHRKVEKKKEALALGKSEDLLECKKCNLSFSSSSLLSNHISLHKNMRKMNWKTKKIGKRRKFNSNSGGSTCQTCGKSFYKPSLLLRHERIHTGEKPFKCTHPGCERAFNQKTSLLNHLNIHSGIMPFICEMCGKAFTQKSNLTSHVARLHQFGEGGGKRFQCSECPCVFRRANSLNAHVSRMHLFDANVPSDKNTKVGFDGNQQPAGQVDTASINSSEMRSNSTESLVKEDALKIRKPNSSAVGSNIHASSVANNGDILQIALKNSGLSQSKEEGKEVEESSNVVKFQKMKLMTVVDGMVPDQKPKHCTLLVRIQDNVKRYICDFQGCTKDFKKPSDLLRHHRVHTLEKPFKCTQCSAAFPIKTGLNMHMKTHLSIKQFGCEVCGKRFHTASSLKIHSWIHIDKKPYRCSQCPKQFRTPSHRKAHILTHQTSAHRLHVLKKKSLVLPDIPLQEPILLTSSGEIVQNNRLQNAFSSTDTKGKVIRPFQCQYCPAAFKQSSHAKQHERRHTGEKPFQCHICFKNFSSRSTLKFHLSVHNGVRPFRCQTCSRNFSSGGSLKRHMSTHSSDRPYMCPYCYCKYKTSTNCKKHMKTHRRELAMNTVINSALTSTTTDVSSEAISVTRKDQDHGIEIISQSPHEVAKVQSMNADSEMDSSMLELSSTFDSDLVDSSLPFSEEQATRESDTIIAHIPPRTLSTIVSPSSKITPSLSYNDATKILFTTTPLDSSSDSSLPLNGWPQIVISPNGVLLDSLDSSISSSLHDKLNLVAPPSHSTIVPQRSSQTIPESAPLSVIDFIPSDITSSSVSQQQTLNSAVSGGSVVRSNSRTANKVIKLYRASSVPHLYSSICKSSETILPSSLLLSDVNSGEMVVQECTSNSLTNSALQGDSRELYVERVIDVSTSKFCEEMVESLPKALKFEDISSTQDLVVHDEAREEIRSEVASKIDENTFNLSERESKRKQRHQTGPIDFKFSIALEKSGVQSDISKKFKCEVCDKSFPKPHHLKMHMKFHKLYFTCKICNKGFLSASQIKEHRKEHRIKTCAFCQQSFPSSLLLNEHSKKCSSRSESGKSNDLSSSFKYAWQCPVCKKVFSNSNDMQKHLENHLQVEISLALLKEKLGSSDEGEGTSKSLSGFASNSTGEIAQNSPESRMLSRLAPSATETFAEDSLESRSLPRLGSNSNDLLAVDFQEAQNLISKSKGNKKGDNAAKKNMPYVCTCCEKGFKKRSDLIRHRRVHTGEKPFHCKICSKQFAVKSTLDVHMRTHEGRKEFRCTTCNLLYASKGSLKVHMRIHTGQKPLSCVYCGMKFRTSGHRKSHISNHFRVKKRRQEVSIVKKAKPKIPSKVDGKLSFGSELGLVNEDVTSSLVSDTRGENTVMINPNGTITLHLNGVMPEHLDDSSILNFQSVSLDDSINPLHYSLELPHSDSGECAANTLVLSSELTVDDANQNSDIDFLGDPKGHRGIGGKVQEEFDAVIEDDNLVTIDVDSRSPSNRTFSAVVSSGSSADTRINNSSTKAENGYFKCPYCFKLLQRTDLQDHLLSHNLVLKSGIVDMDEITSTSSVDIDSFNLKKDIWRS